MINSCVKCGGEALKKQRGEIFQEVAGHTFSTWTTAIACRSCGEKYYDARGLERFELLVAAKLAAAGITDGKALRWMRKAAGIASLDLAKLLDVRPETVSRWENGKRPIDRGSYAVLHQLVLEQLHGSTATKDYLKTLLAPRRLPKAVRIDDSKAA